MENASVRFLFTISIRKRTSESFVFKTLPSNLTSRSTFWAVSQFCFLALKINSSTEETEENLPHAIFQSVRVLCNGSRMTFSSVRSFIISEISSFSYLTGKTITFHGEILSFVLLIGFILNQYKFYSLWFSWLNLSTNEIKNVLKSRIRNLKKNA